MGAEGREPPEETRQASWRKWHANRGWEVGAYLRRQKKFCLVSLAKANGARKGARPECVLYEHSWPLFLWGFW